MSPPADEIDRIMTVMACAFDPRFGEAWTRRQVEDGLLLGHCRYLLADENGDQPDPAAAAQIVTGFALIRDGFGEEELLLFAVAPQYRGKGIGGKLLDRVAQSARERGAERILLEMRRGNTAESIYLRNGFVPIGLRRNYYRTVDGDRIDAITFSRPLK